MRKEQDYYFRKAKQENYPARSVYKLEEAQRKYRFLKKGKRVLDLGCHPGSWSLYTARVLGGKGTVVGIDLKQTEWPGQKDHAEIHWLCYDVYAEDLALMLRRNWPGFHVVLSDMAPRTTGSRYADHQLSLRLARRCLEVAQEVLHPGGTVYCKVFQGEDFPELVREWKSYFQSVKTVKPKSSRKESREVFVLGQGFRKNRNR